MTSATMPPAPATARATVEQRRLGSSVGIEYFQGYPAQSDDFQGIDPHYLDIANERAGTRGWNAGY